MHDDGNRFVSRKSIRPPGKWGSLAFIQCASILFFVSFLKWVLAARYSTQYRCELKLFSFNVFSELGYLKPKGNTLFPFHASVGIRQIEKMI